MQGAMGTKAAVIATIQQHRHRVASCAEYARQRAWRSGSSSFMPPVELRTTATPPPPQSHTRTLQGTGGQGFEVATRLPARALPCTQRGYSMAALNNERARKSYGDRRTSNTRQQSLADQADHSYQWHERWACWRHGVSRIMSTRLAHACPPSSMGGLFLSLVRSALLA
jgi:hypothetical protein